MPRIRKKTSRRGTTNQREKIKHKAAETRKKRKKETKKNPQWKSKHKKDPGIPNNFPYKDQILAEVAEQRRQAEEAKQLRKEQKKAVKAGAVAGDVEDDEASEGEASDLGVFDGVTAIRAAGSSKQKKAVMKDAMDMDEDKVVSVESNLKSLKEVVQEADVVVEVLDARDPLAYHSEHLAGLVKAKERQKLLLVLNKIDATSREAVSSWSTYLRSQHPTALFRSASAFLPSVDLVPSKGKGKARADNAVGAESILSLLGQWATEKTGDKPLVVAVVGLTNAGKSSFIDSLLRTAALPIYQLSNANDSPTTTLHVQEVTLEVGSKQIRLLDTPGYSWHSSEQSTENAETTRAQDILTRNKGKIERLKDPEPVVHQIVSRASQEDLMLFYNLPAFADKDTDAFLRALARASGLVKKGGVLDISGSARIVLRDWSTGKFPRYTVPTAAPSNTGHESSLASLYAEDEKILSTLSTRKELRTSTGLVKLKSSEVESRQLILDTLWTNSEDSEDDDDGEDGEDENRGAEVNNDKSEMDEEEVDYEEDEENEAGSDEHEVGEKPEPLASKRKRGIAQDAVLTSQATKKVAFSAEPRNTKQARKAAGARGSLLAKARTENAKSALKSKTGKAESTPKGVPTKKASNAPSKKSAAPAGAGGDDAYDFKMFF